MNLDSEYEKFNGEPNKPAVERLHATINENGIIRLNATLYATIGKPEAVYLYFNRQKDHIVLAPARPRLPSAFPIKRSHNNYVVRAAPFYKHFGIRIDRTHKFLRPEPESDGKLVLDLTNIVSIALTRPRRKKARPERPA